MRNKPVSQDFKESSSGIEVTLKELIDLRYQVIHQPADSINKWLRHPGQRVSPVRGRGIEFDATREYQTEDDIRSMAWRITARSLKPHIKVFHQEKERPVWLAVDLSPSLYFGTRCMFKSVGIIKQAALLGWSYLQKRERIGTMVATQHKMQIYKPQSTERHFLAILNTLSECSRTPPAFDENNYLYHLLLAVQQQARSGHLLLIFSDFYQFNSDLQKLILHLSQRSQVILFFIYDPFEAEPPPSHQYILTDGKKRVLFNMENAQNRQLYQQQFQDKRDNLIEFSRKHHIALQILCTDQKMKMEAL